MKFEISLLKKELKESVCVVYIPAEDFVVFVYIIYIYYITIYTLYNKSTLLKDHVIRDLSHPRL